MNDQTHADKAHIEQLANEFGVSILYDATPHGSPDDPGPRSDQRYAELHLAPWGEANPGGYWIALHELGHIAEAVPLYRVRVAKLFDRTDLVAIESEAWKWGLDHARRPLDDAGRTEIAYGLSSYIYTAEFGLPNSTALSSIVSAVGASVTFAGIDTPWVEIASDVWSLTVTDLASAA